MRLSSMVVLGLALSGCSAAPGASDASARDAGVDAAGEDGSSSDAGADDDATSRDASRVDAARLDAATTPDASAFDAGTDASIAMPDACVETNALGVADGSTADVFGDDFGRRTIDVTLCVQPAATDTLALHFRARITRAGTELDYDLFGTFVTVNGVGGYRDTLMSWTYVMVSGTGFVDYVLTLPADIDRDGTVDWIAGHNALEVSTWSDYNARPSKTGVDALWVVR
jgi:hypothetical protein